MDDTRLVDILEALEDLSQQEQGDLRLSHFFLLE
jgi:hypothetical protein